MSLLKRLTNKTKLKIAVATLVIVFLVVLVSLDIYYGGPLTSFFRNRDEIRDLLLGLGPLAWLGYIVLQIIQTVIAPIPGNVTGFIGGYVFGWFGVVLTVIGSTIGFWIVFLLSKRFGRRLIEKLFKPEIIKKFDYVADSKGSLLIFVIFLLPGLPDDIVAYLAGLTSLSIRRLMLLAIVGRFPIIVLTNMIGAGANEANLAVVAPLLLLAILLCALAAAFYKPITQHIRKKGKSKK